MSKLRARLLAVLVVLLVALVSTRADAQCDIVTDSCALAGASQQDFGTPAEAIACALENMPVRIAGAETCDQHMQGYVVKKILTQDVYVLAFSGTTRNNGQPRQSVPGSEGRFAYDSNWCDAVSEAGSGAASSDDMAAFCAVDSAFCSDGSSTVCGSGTDYCESTNSWQYDSNGGAVFSWGPSGGTCLPDEIADDSVPPPEEPPCFGWCDGQYNPPPGGSSGGGGDSGGDTGGGDGSSDPTDPTNPGGSDGQDGQDGQDGSNGGSGGSGGNGGAGGSGGSGTGGSDSSGGGDGSGSGGVSGPGDGSCDPAVQTCQEGDGESKAGGLNCQEKPICEDPNAIQCAILFQQWRFQCQPGDTEAALVVQNEGVDVEIEKLKDRLFNSPGAEIAAPELDESGFVGAACPASPHVSVMGTSLVFDLTGLCWLAQMVGVFVMIGAYIQAIRIVSRAF